MTTYTTLSDTALAQDKPLTQSIARAFRDNPLAVTEGDVSAPPVSSKAISSQYFRAYRTTNQVRTGGGANRLQCDVEAFDPTGRYDNVTNFRFTPSVPGLYLVGVRAASDNIGGTADGIFRVYVYKNGVAYAWYYTPVTGGKYAEATITTIVQMNGTTDYIEAYYAQTLGGSYGTLGEFWATALCNL